MVAKKSAAECQVKVRLFGILAEQNGNRHLLLQVSKDTTLAQIARKAGAEDLIDKGLLTALDGAVVSADTMVVSDCEVALMPPVSGG